MCKMHVQQTKEQQDIENNKQTLWISMYVYYMCRNKNEIYKKSEYKIVYLMN